MSQVFKLDDHSEQHVEDFKRFKDHYRLCVQKLNSLQDKFENSLKELKITKEKELTTSELLLNTQKMCNQQLVTIKNLRTLTDEYDDIKNKLSLKNKENEELNEKIKLLKIENDLQLESQFVDHFKELEKRNEEFYNKTKDLQDEISLVLASSEIQRNELESEIKNVKIKYETELKNLRGNNSRLQSTVIIYEKQKCQAEEKNKLLEEENRNLLKINSSFQNNSECSLKNAINKSPEKNVQKCIDNFPKNYENPSNQNNSEPSNMYDYFKITAKNISMNQNNEKTKNNYSKNCEKPNFDKRDTFRKPKTNFTKKCYTDTSDFSSDSECEKNLQSSSFPNRFMTNILRPQKTTFSKPQNVPQNMMPLTIVSEKKKENEPQFPTNRKRKLYNPNNYDYLSEFFVP